MTYLRFSRSEYQALADACRGQDLPALPLDDFRRALVRSLPDALAARVAGFTPGQIRVLAEHLRAGGGTGGGHCLTGEEFEAFVAACAPLLANARFLLPVLGALLELFKDDFPGLAAKLGRLGHREFEALCEQVKARLRGDAG
jgi:hypothetical protein